MHRKFELSPLFALQASLIDLFEYLRSSVNNAIFLEAELILFPANMSRRGGSVDEFPVKLGMRMFS